MNFDFAEQINPELEALNFEKAIALGASELKKIPTTDFHTIIGITLTPQAENLADWVENFYKIASREVDIQALYLEMNEFDINTDAWYIDCFAYSEDGGLDLDDMDWLSGYDTDSETETDTAFQIEGLEKLQTAFETIDPDTQALQDARDWCEQMVLARFMELIRAAHLTAQQKGYIWAAIPVYFTEHGYDFILKSEN